MRGTLLVLTLTLSPVAGWTAGVWHAHLFPHAAARPSHAVEVGERREARPSAVPESPGLQRTDSEPGSSPADDSDVTPAVATYTRDEDGELYEEHSPQTEVARLRSPVG